MVPTTTDAWLTAFAAELTRRYPGRTTSKHYVADVRVFARQYGGALTTVTQTDIATFVDGAHAQGHAPATIKRRVAALKTFFTFVADTCRAAGRPAPANPVVTTRHAPKLPRTLARDLSDADVQRLLAADLDPRDHALVVVLLYAGLRASEVCRLRPQDLTVPNDPAQPVHLRVWGKGQKERGVYLAPEAHAVVRAYLTQCPVTDPAAPLFRTRLGGGFTVAGLEDRMRHAATVSGVAFTAHQLRHTYARWLAERQMPVLALSRLLGHTSVQTTQRYIDGADPQVRQQYAQAMGDGVGLTSLAPPTPLALGAPTPVAPGPATVTRPAARDRPPLSGWWDTAPHWLRDGVSAWLAHQWPQWRPTLRAGHAQKRLRDLRSFWAWRLAYRPCTGWDDLTTADLAAYMQAELDRDRAPTTVKTTVDRVYAVLRFLEVEGRLARVPTRPALRLPDPLPRHLAPAEVAAVGAEVQRRLAVDPTPDVDLALYVLLIQGGLRVGEALHLRVADLDLAHHRLSVRHGKGGRDRAVYMTPSAATVVRAYLLTVPHAADDVVLSVHGHPLAYPDAWARIRRLGVAAGVPDVSPHRLRHTYATHLINNGAGLATIQRLLGHENLSTTMLYARLADTTVERQYQEAMATATSVLLPPDDSV